MSWAIDFVKANQGAVTATALGGGALMMLAYVGKKTRPANQRKAAVRKTLRQADQRAAEMQLRRDTLLERYGDQQLVQAIVDRRIWQGMTREQLLEAWGHPDDVKTSILKTKIKEEFKYRRVGSNRFLRRIYLGNGVVVGWKQ